MQHTRRYDIDYLRIFATYLLFIFHVSKVFDSEPSYQIKNIPLSHDLSVFTGFIHQWHMPLFFVLAGWSIYASLQKRSTGTFVIERIKRIFLPFIAGCILFGPVMQYVHVVQSHSFSGGFIEFLPAFMTLKYFSWSHLWFLIYLFHFTLLLLPFFILFKRGPYNIGEKKATIIIFAAAVPFAFIQYMLREHWPGYQNLYDDWANVAYYAGFLLLGYLIARFDVFETVIQKHRKTFLLIGLFSLVILIIGYKTRIRLFSSRPPYDAVSGIAGYNCVLAFLGFAHRYLNRKTRLHAYLTESAFPVYILHQAAIVIPGYFIIQLPVNMAVKFVILLPVAVILTMTTYHFVVRTNRLGRFLFGMKN